MGKHLTVIIDEETKRKVKIKIATLGISMKVYVLDLINKDLTEDEQSAKKEK